MKRIAWVLMLCLVQGCGLINTLKSDGSDGMAKPRELFKDGRIDADGKPGFYLSIDTYDSCAAIQKSVHDQLQTQEDNKFQRDKYYAENFVVSREPSPAYESVVMSGPAPDPEVADRSITSDVLTNIQESGVDESDYIKIGNNQIFVQNQNEIIVSNREDLATVGNVSTSDLEGVTIYSPNGKLIVIGTGNATTSDEMEAEGNNFVDFQRDSVHSAATIVRVYISDLGARLPHLEREYSIQGEYIDSRISHGRLVLALRTQIQLDADAVTYDDVVVKQLKRNSREDFGAFFTADQDERFDDNSMSSIVQRGAVSENPVEIIDGMIGGIACDQIVKQPIQDMDFQIAKIASIDLDQLSDPKVKGAFGSGSQIYMTDRSLYLTKTGTSWMPWILPDASLDQGANYRTLSQGTAILKADIAPETGEVNIVASGFVVGEIKDQYSFKEYSEQSVLAVATTTNEPLPEFTERSDLLEIVNGEQEWNDSLAVENLGRNHLWVLQQDKHDLKLAKVERNFGEPGEDIRSVRFMNDFAYVVTFKKTDPLYTFDMADPINFSMVGKLKIPGFSMYLHPAGDYMIGVGFDADDQGSFAWYQGLQVSLFNVKDPTNVVRTDNVIHGQRGSSSEVTGNAHAFFYSDVDNIFALPLIELSGKSTNTGSDSASKLDFSGAVFYGIDGGMLVERGRVSHDDLIPDACKEMLSQPLWWQETSRSQDINRIFKIDGHYLTVSHYGMKQFSLQDLAKASKSVKFADVDSCQ